MGRAISHAAVCLSAVIGAGFASGRELMSFFSQYGASSWLGIGSAASAMGLLGWFLMTLAAQTGQTALPGLCRQLLGAWGWLGTCAFSLLLGITAGAMAAAGGELFSLVWPFSGGYSLGVGATLGLALLSAPRGLKMLKIAGYALIPGILLMFGLSERIPAWEGHFLASSVLPMAMLKGLAYAGMNMTLAAPVLLEMAAHTDAKGRRITSAAFGCMLLGLMALGNHVLLRHPELAGEPLPMVQLLRSQGYGGFYLCVSGLYLAVFSTLLAALRGLYTAWQPSLKGYALPAAGGAALTAALGGFTSLIEGVYPLVGWVCIVLLALMGLRLKPAGKCAIMPKINHKGAPYEPKRNF
ncbi:MAG: hypothetical protein IJ461_04325 [Clostridia bacterium]|nr:hypothetical protein [Clostridia bacterium]